MASDTAVEEHLMRGDRALAAGDIEAAVTAFAAAADLTLTAGDDRMALRARLGLGEALAENGDPKAQGVLDSVVALADDLGDADAVAAAALTLTLGTRRPIWMLAPTSPDRGLLARLHDAASRDTGPRRQARLLCALAVNQHGVLDGAVYDNVLDQAQQLADPGSDPELEVLLFVLRHGVRRTPGKTAEVRREIDARLAQAAPFDRAELPLIDLALTMAFRAGDLSAAKRLIERYESELAPLSPLMRWRLLQAKAAHAFCRGSLELARQHAIDAVTSARSTRFDVESVDRFGFQITAILRERHKAADARPTVETWVEQHPSDPVFRSARAQVRAEAGDLAAAATDLEIFFSRDILELRNHQNGLLAVSAAVETATVLAHEETQSWCERGHEVLRDFDGEWITQGDFTLSGGPVSRVLALASATLGDEERALAENDRATEEAQQAGASLFIWHAIRDRGRILQRAGRTKDAARVLRDAAGRYRSAGLDGQADGLEADAAQLDQELERLRLNLGEPRSGEFRRTQSVWRVGLDGETATIRSLKGMAMISALLGAPDREIPATDLTAVAEGTVADARRPTGHGVSQPVVDDRSLAAYRARLEQIAVELDRADRKGDIESSIRLSDEFDALTTELTASQGFGGRKRTMPDENERARVRVTKSIRASIRRIEEHAPGLAAHLDQSISTGRYCIYQSDHRSPVVWKR